MRQIRRWSPIVATAAVAPVIFGWMLLNVAASIAGIVFASFLWLTTQSVRSDIRRARARCTPRLRRRLMLADDHIDEEFRRIVEGQATSES